MADFATVLVQTSPQVVQVNSSVPGSYDSVESFLELYHGPGSPEGVVTAPVGARYRQTDGSNGTVLWVKNSGTGNTGWVVLSTSRGTVYAKDYGCVWDNTTDDSTALQAAITAAAGKVLVLPAGTGLITTVMTVASGTTIVGQGMGVTTLRGASTPTIRKWFTVTGNHVTFSDFALDCGSGGTLGHTGFSFQGGCTYGTVERVWLTNVGQYGISVQDLGTNGGGGGHRFSCNIIDVTNGVTANTSTAIEVFPRGGAGFLASPGIIIDRNIILGDSSTAVGIKVDQNLGARIINNLVFGVSYASGQAGITGVGNRGTLIQGNYIDQCRLGVTISGTPGPDNGLANSQMVLRDNQISRYGSYGIFGAQGIDGLDIVGNLFDLNGAAGTTAIRLDQSSATTDYTGLVIRSNRFTSGSGGIAVVTDGTNTYGAPRGRYEDNDFKAPVGWAISLSGTNGVDATIARNTVYQGTTLGGFVINNGAPRAKIYGNKLLDLNTSAGAGSIGLDINSGNAEIYDNHIENISGGTGSLHTGITVRTGTQVNVRDNRIIGMLTAPMALSGTGSLAGVGTVSANRGDNNVTLTPWQDAEVQVFSSALTANRTITLATTNAVNGSKFRVVRTGLGAFTLDVGGLKTIPSATAAFVDVGYTGAAWILVGYSPL